MWLSQLHRCRYNICLPIMKSLFYICVFLINIHQDFNYHFRISNNTTAQQKRYKQQKKIAKMETNSGTGNENLPPPTLCRNGCGFYGNSQFDGMCSKCYKDSIKRRNQNGAPNQLQGHVSPTGKCR